MLVALSVGLIPAHARQVEDQPATPAERVYTTITQDEIAAIMTEEGYSVSTAENGSLVWKVDGYRAVILVADDRASLQFYAAFSDVDAASDKVNEWNRTKRYSRSYIDADGDPVLELDLDLVGGVTRARIVDFLLTCRDSFSTWNAEVVK